MRNLTLLTTALLLATACSPVEIVPGNGGTVVPSETPNPALFAPVQTALEEQQCGTQVGCHVPPTGTSTLALFTDPGPTPGNIAANAVALSCGSRINTYDPPDGTVVEYFCDQAQQPIAVQHSARTFDAGDCAAMFTWFASGNGAIPACP